MEKKIQIADMHCHIIPGVDDGSPNLEKTMEMLRIAYDEGVRLIISTPHYHIGGMTTSESEIAQRLAEVQEAAKDRYPELVIRSGREIYYHTEAVERINSQEIATMAASKYILLEFDIDEHFDYISSAVYEAVTNGYRPILAHIERYMRLLDRPDRVKQLIDAGAYTQVNAGSVAGKYGRTTQKYIKKLLKGGMIHFVSSDAHGVRHRSPVFADAVKVLHKYCAPDYMEDILWGNAKRVLADEEI